MKSAFPPVLAFCCASTAFAAAPPPQLANSRIQQILDKSPQVPVRSYVELTPEQASTVPMFAPAPGEPLPIFLNRWGGTYYGGSDDSSQNRSSIVYGSSATVGGFGGSESQWSSVLSCVQDQFARFNVYVTDVEPLEGDYVEAVVGGSPEDIGMSPYVGGVAPYDPYGCGVIPNAIVYIFSDVYEGSSRFAREVCETAAQEIAHAFSLDHELLCEDPMTYLSGCGNKSFQDEYASCGEDVPRECSCERPSQNSVQLLYEVLGTNDGSAPPPPPQDLEAPTVALMSPEDGSILDANSVVEIIAEAKDDVGLVAVELAWDFSGESMPCPSEGESYSCTVSGDTYTWSINVGQGLRAFSVMVRDVMGKTAETEQRSVWLSADGSPPPDDNADPEVRFVTPREGVTVPVNEDVPFVVTASDDTGIARVELITVFWGSDVAIPCPFDDGSGRIRCEVTGSTYIWTINSRREGARPYAIRAVDLVGKVVQTPVRTITFEAGAIGDKPVENGTYDLAAPLACGESAAAHIEPGDEDWFAVEGAAGLNVRVSVEGEVADNLDVTAATGQHSSLVFADAEGDPALTFTPPADDDVRVRVRPYSRSGEYTVSVRCFPDATLPPYPVVPTGGCSQGGDSETSPPTGLALLALFGLAFARRRKTRR